jgi:TolA-binding protein
MRQRLTLVLPAAVLLATALPIQAQVTGRVMGKVTAKADGKPIANAKITLKRTERAWAKTLTTDAKGSYGQAGLDPGDYVLTLAAEGFNQYSTNVHISIGDPTILNVQLLKEGESVAPNGTVAAPKDEGAKEENEGLDAFNNARQLYSDGKFDEAYGPIETAYTKVKESLAKTKDEAAKASLEANLTKIERVYAICLFEVGKKDQAKPLLEKAFARNEPEGKLDKTKYDVRVIDLLARLAKEQKDAEGEKKYQGILDTVTGPRPENAYNEGVAAFNAGKFKEAKEHIQKAIQIKPDFSESYYLLGLIEVNNGNIKGAKAHFQKYLELDPKGKKAGEVREMLKAL